ncbi:MAG: ADP-forming succinate--CoA ligase subunit beta [Bdellovibrionaceae bacterium]|nr:ADP-forming succinate--CoA ligase subunit beta [Pseudobdellovibrionaceae bacterium]MDW8189444.1 ADP-forming succinate--CoA ligase subunit beta [Pseudobdellovibrionaceae bacterium]
MNIHEYQAKEVLKEYGVPLLKGGVAYTPEEAEKVAATIGGSLWVIKAQIHAGGRGKAGGVKLARSLSEVAQVSSQILGRNLVTHQTGPQGKQVHKVYVEEGCQIEREFYCALMVDRSSQKVTLLYSAQGGMDIEELAERDPAAINKITINPVTGFLPFHGRLIAEGLKLKPQLYQTVYHFFKGLYLAFVEKDAFLIEVNPLVLTHDERLIALDAKMSFDSNALFRHPEIMKYRDLTEEDPTEIEASKYDLSFIKLDGNIGCLVNGAGLAMATLDIIRLHGAMPANFLDVGGGASQEKVTAAFRIILKDPKVKAILINIFGGIMKCDIIAQGVIAASKEVGLKVPVVVRLEGTNVELGRKLLQESGLNIIAAHDLNDAAQKVVACLKEA